MYLFTNSTFPLETKLMGIFIFILLFLTGCSMETKETNLSHQEIQLKAKEANQYCIDHGFDTTFCILIDMKVPSGKYRFFTWDFTSGSIVDQSLCSHGSCANIELPNGEKLPYFTNQPNSYCSSLGKYKIGKRGYSNYGIHVNYKLHGLETSNSNAFDRIIVLHSFDGLSEDEIFPNKAMTSWGCPAVSNEMMKRIDTRLQKTEKPVLLWIYN